MNDKLQNVLAELASKFGTSVDHLWKVMVYQARISACIDILQYSILFVTGIILFRVHSRLRKVVNGESGRYADTGYDKNEWAGWIVGISSAVWFIIVVIAFFSIGDSISAFANPEYWALKQILDK